MRIDEAIANEERLIRIYEAELKLRQAHTEEATTTTTTTTNNDDDDVSSVSSLNASLDSTVQQDLEHDHNPWALGYGRKSSPQ